MSTRDLDEPEDFGIKAASLAILLAQADRFLKDGDVPGRDGPQGLVGICSNTA